MDKPINVQVAEAVGWTGITLFGEEKTAHITKMWSGMAPNDYPGIETIPDYVRDYNALMPLLDKYNYQITRFDDEVKVALYPPGEGCDVPPVGCGTRDTFLEALCAALINRWTR